MQYRIRNVRAATSSDDQKKTNTARSLRSFSVFVVKSSSAAAFAFERVLLSYSSFSCGRSHMKRKLFLKKSILYIY